METIGYILASVTFIWLWDTKVRKQLLMREVTSRLLPNYFEYRTKFTEWLDRKPVNCGTCLSFWTGVSLFMVTGDVFLLSLPLSYKIITKIIS